MNQLLVISRTDSLLSDNDTYIGQKLVRRDDSVPLGTE